MQILPQQRFLLLWCLRFIAVPLLWLIVGWRLSNSHFHFDLEVFLFLLLLYLYVPVFKTRACFTFNLHRTEYEYGEILTSSIRFISFFDSKQYLCIVLVNLQISLLFFVSNIHSKSFFKFHSSNYSPSFDQKNGIKKYTTVIHLQVPTIECHVHYMYRYIQ